MISLSPPLPLSLRVTGTKDYETAQTVGQWGETVKTGEAASRCPPVLLCIIPSPASASSLSPPGTVLPSKAFSVLSYTSNVLPEFLAVSKNCPTMSLQSLTPHMHSAPLVHRVTTLCMGNYAAGDKQHLAVSIISIINHWNCPLILNSGIHSVLRCSESQSHFVDCVYCMTVICLFILLFYKWTFSFLKFFVKSMNFEKLMISNPPWTTLQKKYKCATYVFFLSISSYLMTSDNI